MSMDALGSQNVLWIDYLPAHAKVNAFLACRGLCALQIYIYHKHLGIYSFIILQRSVPNYCMWKEMNSMF